MKDRKVEDLMLSLEEYATISSECTIKEALQALDESQVGLVIGGYRQRAILVLDRGGKVVGKLSHWAILRSLEPKYLKNGDLYSLSRAGLTNKFIESMQETFASLSGSLAAMCRAAARLKVKDAMVPINVSIDKEEPLVRAIDTLILNHAQSLPVTSGGTVVGVLRLSDVFDVVKNMVRNS